MALGAAAVRWSLLPALLGLALAALPQAAAHATLVLGSLATEPDPPIVGEPVTLLVDMTDPAQLPIEDAVLRIELTPPGGAAPISANFEEAAPGRYRSEVVLPEAGEYQVLVRDRTFRQEEVTARFPLTVGQEAQGSQAFVLPPTATAPRSIGTWLIWLIGLPVAAAIVVTALVLFSGRGKERKDA